MNQKERKFKKRLISGMLSVMLVASVFISSCPAASAATATTTDKLNLRNGPGSGYTVVKVMDSGVTVTVLDTSNAQWTKVRLSDGTEGYCSTDYLKTSTASSDTTTSSNTGTGSGTLTMDTRFYTMAPGNVYDFRAKVEGQGLNQSDVVVTSSRTGIATVARVPGTDKYRITGVSEGVCYVIAEIQGVHASIKVTVQKGVKQNGSSERSISIIGGSSSGGNSSDNSSSGSGSGTSENLSLDTNNYTFSEVGKTYQFLAKGIASGSNPIATSSKPSVATVSLVNANDSRGYLYELKSVSAGVTMISITVGNSTVFMMVTVEGDTSNGGSTGGNTETPTITGAKTTDVVNLRSGPGTSYSRVTLLSKGTSVTVLDTSNSAWTKVRTTSGQEGYISSEYLQFEYSNGSSSVTGLKLSHSSGSIPKGKTYYITATVTPSGSTVNWTTSNSAVATVSNGFIYGVSPGSAVITATDAAGKYKATCNVTVTEAEPVKTAYTSPNIAGVNETVELIAVTDNTRDKVRFIVDMNDGTTQTYDVAGYTEENSSGSGLANNYTRVWKTAVSFSTTGTYKVTVYSFKNGSMSSTGVTTSSFVVASQDYSVSTTESRRVSDEMLELMGKWEGYSAAVYPDTLAYNIPTIGYGHTFSAGTVFYNNLTKTEAWSLLLNTVNSSYTTAVNTFISSNNLKCSQHQFDAMISFSHNVGTGYWNGTSNFDIKTILLNAVVPPTIPSGSSMSAVATANFKLYDSPDGSYITEVSKDAAFQVLDTRFDTSNNSCWYQIQTLNGTVGWGRAGYIRFDGSSGMEHDLNYTDAIAIGSEWLAWHHAGGKCYAGLVYRRLGEAKVFSYGNYSEASNSSSLYKHNTYGYEYPSCAKQFEQ